MHTPVRGAPSLTTVRLQKTSSLSSPLIMSNSSTKAGAVSASSDISVKEESASGYESDVRPNRKRSRGKGHKQRQR